MKQYLSAKAKNLQLGLIIAPLTHLLFKKVLQECLLFQFCDETPDICLLWLFSQLSLF